MKNISKIVIFILVSVFTSMGAFQATEEVCGAWASDGPPYGQGPNGIVISHNDKFWTPNKWWINATEEPGVSSSWDEIDPRSKVAVMSCHGYLGRIDRASVIDTTKKIELPKDFDPFVSEPEAWEIAEEKTERCDITMDLEAEGQCIFPYQLQDAKFVLPANVTRFSKEAFKLCALDVESDPTVVIYIYDHSGSMKVNDPSQIADEAFVKALNIQYEIDSNSWAGYIPFSDVVENANVFEPATLSGGGLTAIKSKINADYDGGTIFKTPLEMAKNWLDDPKFDGFNKLIIFMADGQPTDSKDVYTLIEQDGFPVIHSMYLQKPNDADTLDAGGKLMDEFSWMTIDERDFRGTFTHVKAVEDLESVIRSLIETYVNSARPKNMMLINRSINTTISVDQTNMTLLQDSSYAVKMQNNMPLLPGINHMTLRSEYTGVGGTQDINFQIEITDSIMNSSANLTNAPFKMNCEEITGLTIFDQTKNRVDLIDYGNDSLFVQYAAIKEGEKGALDSVKVWLVSVSKDTLITYLYKNDSLSTSSLVYYDRGFAVKWMTKSNTDDDVLQLSYLDNLYAVYQHPDDPQDRAQTNQLIYWEMPSTDSIAYFDDDSDGILDRIDIYFPRKIYPEEWENMRFSWKWPDVEGGLREYAFEKTGLLTFIDTPFNKITWEPRDSILFPLYTGKAFDPIFIKDYEKPDLRKVDTLEVDTQDKMPPIFKSARVKVSGEEGGIDTLKIIFSENIPWNKLSQKNKGNLFDFILDKELVSELDYSESYRFEDSMMRIAFGGRKNLHFTIVPGDSIRMIPFENYIVDEAGNRPLDPNPWFYIGGELRQNTIVNVMGYPDDENSYPGKDPVKLTVVDGEINAKEWFEKTGTIGLSWGPFRMQGKEDDDPIIKWSFQVYDNLGQFVNQMEGKVDCSSKDYKRRCESDEGISLVFEWNFRSFDKRLVGTGAYVLRAVIEGKEKVSSIGVLRK